MITVLKIDDDRSSDGQNRNDTLKKKKKEQMTENFHISNACISLHNLHIIYC